MDNWDPRPVFVDGKYISKDTWYDADGKPFQPQVHYFVGGATKLYGAALYRLRPAGLRRDQARRRDLPGLAADYDDFEPWYTKAEQLYQVHGNGGEDPTEGHRVEALPVARGVARAADPADLRRPGQGRLPPVPRAVRDPARTRPTGPRSTCIRCTWCDGYPVPGARQVRRRGDRGPAAARPAQRHPAHRRRGDQARDRPVRAHGHRGRRHPRRRARRSTAADIVVVSRRGGQQRQDPAQLGQRPAPERPGQRLGPGRAQLHVPQLQGGRGAGQGAQRHGLPEDAGHQRLLLRHRGLRRGRWATSR